MALPARSSLGTRAKLPNMSSLPGASKVAQSVFNGVATEALEAVDVYNTITPEVRNRFSNLSSAFGQSLDQALGKQSSLLGRIGNLIKDGALNLQQARDQINGVLSGSRGLVDGLTKDFRNDLLGSLSHYANELPVQIRSAKGEIKNLPYDDFADAIGVTGFTRDILGTGLFETIDTGAQAAVIGGVLETVSGWGMPDLIDDVLSNIEDPKIKRQVVENSSRNISVEADIDTLERFINGVGPTALTAKTPDIAKTILQNYHVIGGIIPTDYSDRLDQLVNVLDTVQPNWLYTHRSGTQVWNLSVVNRLSDEARLVLTSSEIYRVPVMIASHYPVTDPIRTIRHMYPLIAIS